MTERKPAGVSFEYWVDAQIRAARERGEFENLPGHGKPLANVDGNHDEMWWIKQWLRRENISFTPPAIALRKAAEDLLESGGAGTHAAIDYRPRTPVEADVRRARIDVLTRQLLSG